MTNLSRNEKVLRNRKKIQNSLRNYKMPATQFNEITFVSFYWINP